MYIYNICFKPDWLVVQQFHCCLCTAPSIYENDDIKKGILLQLFGGTRKDFQQSGRGAFRYLNLCNITTISSRFKYNVFPICGDTFGLHLICNATHIIYRADINILLCGDPGTSKSQLLQVRLYSSHKCACIVISLVCVWIDASRSVHIWQRIFGSWIDSLHHKGPWDKTTCVTNVSGRDNDDDVMLHHMTSHSGALVLSDNGICCIDEFDKMNDNTRAILHEVMVRQVLLVSLNIQCEMYSFRSNRRCPWQRLELFVN